MKTLQKALLALVAGSVLSVSAQAAVGTGPGEAYVGAKVGQFILDDSDLSSPTAYGVVGGYQFTPNWGAEVEYVGSSKEDVVISGVAAEYSVKEYGAFGTYRHHFDSGVYAKGKLGFANAETKLQALGVTAKEDVTKLSGGIGLGYTVSPNFSVETDYSVVQGIGDMSLLTLGANYKF